MVASIAGILNFNMFGIPHVGASVGGFYGDADNELLTRWYELGCFSPLMVSYGHSAGNRKEAYALTEHKEYIRNALIERYMLLHYFYTKIFESFMWGGPVVHPVFFEFPDDDTLYKPEVVDRTFMWGKQLYIIPALSVGRREHELTFPIGDGTISEQER
jgi:alpha-glucosidase (family GH31 glycosyl hydrolase)